MKISVGLGILNAVRKVLPAPWREVLARDLIRSARERVRERVRGEERVIFEREMEWRSFAYSQEGEDLILHRIFERKPKGLYVDVGAHHPKRFSNTYAFYCRGWRGINIDATPGSMEAFRLERPEDINLEIAVGNQPGQRLAYFLFNEPALNTFSQSAVEDQIKNPDYHVVEKVSLEVCTLSSILEEYLVPEQTIDFLSIDVEGLDFEVLQSNDWGKFLPTIILIENYSLDFIEEHLDSPIHHFLASKGYGIFGKTVNTLVFAHRDAEISHHG